MRAGNVEHDAGLALIDRDNAHDGTLATGEQFVHPERRHKRRLALSLGNIHPAVRGCG